jgi:D-alanine--poly(phosphoribitol) ligase subunit 1
MYINVLDYLEEAVKKYPNKVVFADLEKQITYGELIKQARAIGSCLAAEMKAQTKKPVAVLIDRSITSLIAFMGVVFSGNFYVPIDGQMPKNRIELIFKTLQPQVVILPRCDSEWFKESGFNARVIYFEDALSTTIHEERLKSIKDRAIDTDPLYAIFTSGSTGIPKGTVVCHRSVIDLIEHFSEIFEFSNESIFGNQAPFDFDVSVKDIYSTLKNGATLQVIPKVMFSFPIKLIEFLNKTNINTIIWATSALRIVANLKSLEKDVPLYLKTIMFSGEVMPNKVLNYWRQHLPDAMYVNLYGPTEITCNCTYFMVKRPFADNDMLPIGIPFPNTDILVLNEANQLVGKDEIGEICVRGTSLALGYYNNPDETARAFCQNPLNLHYPELIYRTGDLGKYNDLGELLFLSRKDYQIKHMGHRIELGEIEVAVNALNFLDVACCLYDEQNEKIVLFYQASKPCDKEILLGLRDYLPKYMLPNRLVYSEKLPMNKNAKIDRVRLKKEYIDASGQ